MKKETSSYIINIAKSEYFIIDLINLIVGIAVLVSSVWAFISGMVERFGIVFILGAVLSLFNLVKTIMRKSIVGMLLFSCLTMVMFAMIAVIYGYLL